MNNKKTIKKILIGFIIAIAILVLYSIFNSSTSKNMIVSSGSLSSLVGSSSGQINEADTTVANAEILKVLGSIEHIELHDGIFSNPVFRKLKDTNFAIPRPSVVGRKNPFLPIGFNTVDDLENTQTVDQNNQEGDFFSELDKNLN